MIQNKIKVHFKRNCIACDKEFFTDIDLLHYCNKCLSLDDLTNYLYSDASEWSK